MNSRNRLDSPLGFLECSLNAFQIRTARLKTQQSRNRLQIILHAVVNLANRCVLCHEFLFASTNLGDITRQDDSAQTLMTIDKRKRTQGDRDPLNR